jgi:F-type H+-transporting ATPase subunit epsilon
MTQENPSQNFRCQVHTLSGPAVATEARGVVFPAVDGLVGVLRGAGPMVAAMGAGPLEVHDTGGKRLRFFVAGGFARVRDNVATILADECVAADRLDPADARRRLDEALALPARTDEESRARRWALQVARARLRVAEGAANR